MLTAVMMAAHCTQWWQFAFFYGAMYPVGLGLTQYPAMVCAWEWFPENKSIVTGSILVANGLGQLLYGAVSTAIVNPTNEAQVDGYFPEEVADRVPHMFNLICVMWAMVAATSIVLTRRKDTTEDQLQDDDSMTDLVVTDLSKPED